jgi:hypothetical protein
MYVCASIFLKTLKTDSCAPDLGKTKLILEKLVKSFLNKIENVHQKKLA